MLSPYFKPVCEIEPNQKRLGNFLPARALRTQPPVNYFAESTCPSPCTWTRTHFLENLKVGTKPLRASILLAYTYHKR